MAESTENVVIVEPNCPVTNELVTRIKRYANALTEVAVVNAFPIESKVILTFAETHGASKFLTHHDDLEFTFRTDQGIQKVKLRTYPYDVALLISEDEPNQGENRGTQDEGTRESTEEPHDIPVQEENIIIPQSDSTSGTLLPEETNAVQQEPFAQSDTYTNKQTMTMDELCQGSGNQQHREAQTLTHEQPEAEAPARSKRSRDHDQVKPSGSASREKGPRPAVPPNKPQKQNISAADAPKPITSIQVRYTDKLDDTVLVKYFANPNRSGGGEILDHLTKPHQHWAMVTFEKSQDASRVLKSKSHELEHGKFQLYVSPLPPMSKTHLFVQMLPNYTTEDFLQTYMNGRTLTDVSSVRLKMENNTALVTFPTPVQMKWEEVQERCRQVKFNGTDVVIEAVHEPDAVQFFNVPENLESHQLCLELEDILQKQRETKHSVLHVIQCRNEKMALVIFDSHRVLAHLEQFGKLEFQNGVKLSFERYFDCMGFLSQPSSWSKGKENTKQTSVQRPLLAILKTHKGKKHANQLLRPRFCTWDPDEKNGLLSVTAEPDEVDQLQEMSQIILDSVQSRTLKLDEEQIEFVGSEDFTEYQTCLTTAASGALLIEKEEGRPEITIFSTSDFLQQHVHDIQVFFEENVKYTRMLVNDPLMVKYFKDYKTYELSLVGSQAEVISSTDTVLVRGPKQKLDDIESKHIKPVLETIGKQMYPVTRPGASDVLREEGKHYLGEIEKATNTVIEPIPDDPNQLGQQRTVLVKQLIRRSLSSSNSRKPVTMEVLIKVIQGDICAEKADAIVNAANQQLDHISGVAGAIIKHGGSDIRKECNDHISKNGPMEEGSVFVSGPGKLPCKMIIHAVAPIYKDGQSDEAIVLRKAVENSMLEAIRRLGISSICFPAISCGVYRHPVDKAIPVIVEAAVDMALSCQSELKEIRFIEDTNPVVLEQFQKEVTEFGKKPRKKEKKAQQKPLQNPGDTKGTMQAAGSSGTGQQVKYTTANGLEIFFVEGDIAVQATDAVVNSTSQDLLGGGNSAQHLLKCAGSAVEDEIKKWQSNNKSGLGDKKLVATGAGKLRQVRSIFHICAEPWNFSSSINKLKETMHACLKEGGRMNYQSISFPAIGTGGLNYPKPAVAEAMFDAVCEFDSQQAQSKIKKVNFVVFPSDHTSVSAFQKEFGNRTGQPIQPSISVALQFGECKVEILEGDISEESSACIVCPVAETVVDFGQVGNVLQQKGGRVFKQQISAAAKQSDLAQDPIFMMETKNSISAPHVMFVKFPKSTADLEKAIGDCLQRMDSSSITSASFPVLGTGNARLFSGKDVATVMLHAFQRFGTPSQSQTSLKNIRVVIFQPEIAASFNQVARELLGNKTVKEGSKQKVKQFFQKEKPEPLIPPRAVKPEVPLKLAIVGTQMDRARAMEKLDKKCTEMISVENIPWQKLANLQPDQMRHLKFLATQMNLHVNFHQAGNEVDLVVEGLKAREYCSAVRACTADWEVARVNALRVKWHYREITSEDEWELFDEQVTGMIESCITRLGPGQQSCFNIHGMEFDLNSMVMRPLNTNEVFNIKRKDAHDIIPVEWVMNEKEVGYQLIPLSPTSNEYKKVIQEVQKTSSSVTITKIERVESPVRYKQYMTEKQRMENLLAHKSVQVERLLFHGTNPNNVAGICSDAFDRGFFGTSNAYVYGQGVYFARDFSYSSDKKYGPPVFMAQVLTGEFCQGSPDMRYAPNKPDGSARYESVVNNVKNPTIFVTFHDSYAYPAYLIHF